MDFEEKKYSNYDLDNITLSTPPFHYLPSLARLRRLWSTSSTNSCLISMNSFLDNSIEAATSHEEVITPH